MVQIGLSERDSQFYYEDGNIILLVQEHPKSYLYRVYAGLLKEHSAFFRDTLSIPREPTTINVEGCTDETPIVLPDYIKRDDFNYFLCYLLHARMCYPTSNDFLIAVLKLSTFLLVDHGVKFAIAELEWRVDVSPIIKMHLAIMYRVDHWVPEEFKALMKMPLDSFTRYDVDLMGSVCFLEIVQTKFAIQQWRLGISFDTPLVINHRTCTHKDRCRIAWETEWWNGMVKLILHPDASSFQDDIIRELDKVKIPKMCDDCQEETIDNLKGEGVLALGDGYIEEAIGRMMAWQTDTEIRRGFRTITISQ